MNKPILEIISVTYGHGFKLKCFIDSIRSQTNPNWCLHIVHDGTGEVFDDLKEDLSNNGYLNDSRVVLSATASRSNNWGHPLREYGLQNRISNSPYITITNCDNYYVPIWISEINNLSKQDKDFIHWDCVHDHRGYELLPSQLKLQSIDMGSAAIRSDIVTQVGFPFRSFAADWEFFTSCLKHTSSDKIQKIPKILFVHN
jgi:hypothetical protein